MKIHIPFAFSERYRNGRRVRATAFRDGFVSGRDEALHRRRLCSRVAGSRSAPGQLYSLQELEETSDQGMSLWALETSCTSFHVFFSLHFFSHPQVFLLSVVFCSFSNELVVIPNVSQERCVTQSEFYPRGKVFNHNFDGILALIVAIIN